MERALYVLARAGLAAKGTNYLLIGLIASVAVLTAGQNTTGRAGAWRTLMHQPFGRILLLVLALGFFCYAAWRVLAGTMDLECRGRKLGGVLKRAGTVIAGISYVLLGASAGRFAVSGAPPPSDNAQARSVASTLLGQPLGVPLVAGVGVGFAIAAIVLAVMAVKGTFSARLDLARMNATERAFAMRAGRLGLATLSLLLAMSSAFFFFAAATHDSREAKGLAGALATLAAQPFGRWLLALVCAGFLAHGVFQFVELRYLRRDVCQ